MARLAYDVTLSPRGSPRQALRSAKDDDVNFVFLIKAETNKSGGPVSEY